MTELFVLTIQQDVLQQKFDTDIMKKYVTFLAPESNSEYVYFGDFCVKWIANGAGIGYRLSPFWGVGGEPFNKKVYMHNSRFWYISGKAGDRIIGFIENDPVQDAVTLINSITGKQSLNTSDQ